MKIQILFALVIFPFLNCKEKSIPKTIEKQSIELVSLPPEEKIDENRLIGFGCYFSGRKSEPVKVMGKLLTKKDYIGIRAKLSAKSTAERYLATAVCTTLEAKKVISLTPSEQTRIKQNMMSPDKVVFCSGCTFEEEFTMKELLASGHLNNWLKEMIQ
ncbi:hypothetical protein NAT51_02755 [Flavobacterium amniphilum]|uniref:hypothetical protein n=1 Tax=Flavobacterium amniphilum TaxID=1834035 RepID=UPI00202AA175|nr:hypothetical protein [Flavobacterium amniphilum]MCL9804425.1 hypothetical protein [Flavobacterium amniphilum]